MSLKGGCAAVVFAALCFAARPAAAFADDALPPSYIMTRWSPRVLDFFGGPGSVKSHIVVVASEKGLVVVDAGSSPRLAGEVKAAASREFGRSDFRWIILTHSHDAHAWGSGACPGGDIIAHRLAGVGWAALAADARPALAEELAFSRGRIAEWAGELARCGPDSKAAAAYRLIIAREEALVRDYESGFAVLPPAAVFDDRLTLDLGDMKAELVYSGPAHGVDDILVSFPEEGLLLTGDLSFDFGLGSPRPDDPLPDKAFDVPRWLAALDAVLSGPRLPERVVSAHRRETGGGRDLARRRAYLGAAWDKVLLAQSRGQRLDAFLAASGLDAFFPEAAAWPLGWSGTAGAGEKRIRHINLLRLFWREAERARERTDGGAGPAAPLGRNDVERGPSAPRERMT